MVLPLKDRCKYRNVALNGHTYGPRPPEAQLTDLVHFRCSYKEVPRIMDFDWKTLSDGFEEPVDDIQGIMADPPWAFIVEDGRNDGACKLTPNEFVCTFANRFGTLGNWIFAP